MLDRSRLPARLQHELKTPRTDPIHTTIGWMLGLVAAIIFILAGIFFLAMVDRPGIGRSKRASLDMAVLAAVSAVQRSTEQEGKNG